MRNKLMNFEDTMALGFRESHVGTRMLRYAVNFAASERTRDSHAWNMMITKNIYPAVAKEFGSTPQRVERNIRAAVKAAGIQATNGEIVAQLSAKVLEERGRESED